MPKPTAAANAPALSVTSRRAILKAGGALGTIAALAVPVAVLPKAEASEADTIAALWAERERLKAAAAPLRAILEEARARFESLKPELPKEGRAHPTLFGYGVRWRETPRPDGTCIVWGGGDEWRALAENITGVAAATYKAGCRRRAAVMDAYEARIATLWKECGIDDAWNAWSDADDAQIEAEERILALPITCLRVAASQARILRDWGCGEDDMQLMAFFGRIDAAARAGDHAFAVRETA